MKNEIMQRLTAVLTALNNISVNGKQNLANLSGSIAVIEDIMTKLQTVDFIEETKKEIDK